MTKHWSVVVTASLATLLALLVPAPVARADIFQWEYINPANPSLGKQPSTMLTPGGAGVNAAPDADLSGRNLTMAYLIGANLGGANMRLAKLTNAELSEANLTDVAFSGSFDDDGAHYTALTGASFTNAEVRGTQFGLSNLTTAQLYSTASYQAQDLTRIGLQYLNLTGANFAGQNLTNAEFGFATLTNANFTQANLTNASFHLAALTGANLSQANLTNANFYIAALSNANFSEANLTNAYFSYWADLTGANLSHANLTNANFAGLDWCNDLSCGTFPGTNLTNANLSGADARAADFYAAPLAGANLSNMIGPDGHIDGLDLAAGASLAVRDYENYAGVGIPIVVDQHLATDASGTLRLVFDADPWNSTISFAPGIPVARGGTLELTFASDVNLASQLGRTIDLFDWTGVTPTGAFTVSSPYTWNLTNLYTTGEVTLAAAPTLPGDFNNDGTVDAADYVMWRKTGGTATQYTAWRNGFGEPFGSGGAGEFSSGDVPEPAVLVLLVLGAAGFVLNRRAR